MRFSGCTKLMYNASNTCTVIQGPCKKPYNVQLLPVWQSLETRTTQLDPRSSKTLSVKSRVESFEFWVELFEFRVEKTKSFSLMIRQVMVYGKALAWVLWASVYKSLKYFTTALLKYNPHKQKALISKYIDCLFYLKWWAVTRKWPNPCNRWKTAW